MPFKEIPILDMSLAKDASTKPAFLERLRDVLLNVGFLYIKNTGIDQDLYDKVCEEGIRFFDLPEDEKLRIEMKQQRSFLGYSKVQYQPFSLTPVQGRLTKHPSWEWKSLLLMPTGESKSISVRRIPFQARMHQSTTICSHQTSGPNPN